MRTCECKRHLLNVLKVSMWQGWEHKREVLSFYYHESEKPVGCN